MKEFFRKMMISAVVTSCILWGFLGFCEVYSSIREIGYGEYRKAIEIEDGKIKIFDYIYEKM